MALKDLSAHFAPNLELPYRDKVFTVPPPTRDDGLLLAAINAVGVQTWTNMQGACPTCGRSGEIELAEETLALVEGAKDRALGEISLGPAYQEMLDAGIPAPDLELFELYAMYFWVLGEEAADQIVQARTMGRESSRGPKVPRLPKNGPSSGSVSRSGKTKTASPSTRTTGSRKSSSPARRPGNKDQE